MKSREIFGGTGRWLPSAFKGRGLVPSAVALAAAGILIAGGCTSEESPAATETTEATSITAPSEPPAPPPPSPPVEVESAPPPPPTATSAAPPPPTTSTVATTSTSVSVPPAEPEPPPQPSLPEIRSVAAPAWQPSQILVANPDLRTTIPVFDAANGTQLSFRDGELWSYTYRGNPLVVRVTQGSEGDEWVEAELPIRSNDQSSPGGVRGWLRTENFDWRTVNHHIQVDLSDDRGYPRVDYWNGDTWVTGSYAIVGRSGSATPVMDSFVVEKYPASRDLGSHVLMLSGFSTTFENDDGALPRISLHGTDVPERVGERISNGDIRVPDEVIGVIYAQAPLGTRVNIIP